MEIRTDRLGALLDQLATSRQFAAERLEGLTADEHLWEPFPDMWSVRRRGEATTPDAYGPGEWVLDFQMGLPPFGPGPLSTIAWRIGHLSYCFAGRWEWTFGGRSTPPQDVVPMTPDPDEALATMWHWVDRFGADCEGLTDEQLEVPGFGQFPHGLDPELPFIGIIWWVNRELIHHTAEVALLRDLHARWPT